MPKPIHVKLHGELGALLRQWRDARGTSQLELSLSAGISQRHLSFIEIGRSVPGREVLIRIAEALEVPYRDRNALLLAAGYAPRYEDASWDDRTLAHVTTALRRVLRQQEPYPALVLNRYWEVVLVNDSAPRFFGCFVNLAARPKPRNLLHLLFDPTGLRPCIANWEELAHTLIQRVRRETVGGILDARSHALLDALLAYPGARPEWRLPAASTTTDVPVIPIRLKHNGAVLSYFSMLTTLATPQSIATQELRIECMFPLDRATELQHVQLMEQAGADR